MTMPNFLMIGANKAGTTSLYHYLGQHPQVYVSPVKEPMYFTLMSHTIGKKPPGLNRKQQRAIYHEADYRALFDGVEDQKAYGEFSTSYLNNPAAARNIRASIPDVKLLAVLRNPIERAYSDYIMHLEWGVEKRQDFGRVIEDELQFLGDSGSRKWRYLKLGFYTWPLSHYFKLFGREQIALYLFDDLRQNAGALVQDMYRFLDVDPDFPCDVTARANEGPRTPRGRRKPPLTEAMRGQLADVYREEVHRLQEVLDRDLSHWLAA